RLDRHLRLDVARGVDLAVGGHEGDPEDVRVDLGQGGDVVRVLSFLQVLVLRVGAVERGLDLGRRLRPRRGRAQSEGQQARGQEHAPSGNRLRYAHHLPPRESLKLYLAENWMRKSSDVKPSRKFSRLPHWISGPRKTLGVG